MLQTGIGRVSRPSYEKEVLALLFRRSIFGATTAVIGGLVLYYGMYLQTNIPLMEAATGFGLVHKYGAVGPQWTFLPGEPRVVGKLLAQPH